MTILLHFQTKHNNVFPCTKMTVTDYKIKHITGATWKWEDGSSFIYNFPNPARASHDAMGIVGTPDKAIFYWDEFDGTSTYNGYVC